MPFGLLHFLQFALSFSTFIPFLFITTFPPPFHPFLLPLLLDRLHLARPCCTSLPHLALPQPDAAPPVLATGSARCKGYCNTPTTLASAEDTGGTDLVPMLTLTSIARHKLQSASLHLQLAKAALLYYMQERALHCVNCTSISTGVLAMLQIKG